MDGEVTKIYIANGKKEVFEVLIDTEDLEKVINYKYCWYPLYDSHIDGYYIRATVYVGMINGKAKYRAERLHRLVMNAEEDECVDHINHKTLDNRKCNLRKTTNIKNTKHRKSKNSNNKSGYRNVSLIDGKYIVQLQVEGKNTRLGSFDDVDEAGAFAALKRKELYGDFAGENNRL